MQRGAVVAGVLVCGLAIFSQTASGAIPRELSFQGRLTDGAEDPVTDGSHSITFTIYDAATAGTAIWAETLSVTTSNGLFTVLLGADTGANPLDLAFDMPYWLGIQIASDLEMTPRYKLAAAPYAFAAGNADTLDGLDSTDFADTTTVSALDLQGVCDVGATYNSMLAALGLSASDTLTLGADSDANASGDLALQTAGTTKVLVENDGDVGIGVAAPTTKLDVSGTVTADAFAGDGSLLTSVAAEALSAIDNVTVNADSDSDTTGQIALQTQGSTRMAVTNSGWIGVGTESPWSPFMVEATNTGTVTLRESTDSHTDPHENVLLVANGSGAADSQARIQFGAGNPDHGRATIAALHDTASGTYGGTLVLRTRYGATSYHDAITVRGSGNVGIGTADPSTALDVNGTVTADDYAGDALAALDTFTLGADSDANATGDLALQTAGTTKLIVENDGDVGIGVAAPTTKLDVDGTVTATAFAGDGSQLTSVATDAVSAVNSVTVNADSDSDTTGQIELQTQGSTRITVTNDGWVSVGTDSPLSPFMVEATNSGTVWLRETTDSHTDPHESVLVVDNSSSAVDSEARIQFAAGSPDHGRATVAASADTDYPGTFGYGGRLTLKTRDGDGSTTYHDVLTARGNGKVGLGVDDPTTKLEVDGTVTATAFVGNGASLTGITGASGGVANTDDTTVGADTDSNGTGVLRLQTRATSRMYVGNTGWIGVGTESPWSPFMVEATNTGTVTLRESTDSHTDPHENVLLVANGSGAADSQARIQFGAGNPDHGRATIAALHDTVAGTYGGTLILRTRYGATSYHDAITVRGSGNVGIGTADPSTALDVNGTVTATSLKTATRSVGTDDALTTTDHTLFVDATGSGVTVTLPAASADTVGRVFYVYKTDAGANTVSVAPNGADSIIGNTVDAVTVTGAYVRIVGYNATTWIVR